MIPATVPLRSRSSTRILSFHIEEEVWLAFDFHLPPKPQENDAWGDYARLRDARTTGSATLPSGVHLRYRLVAAG